MNVSIKEGAYAARPECPGCGSSSFTANPHGSPICDYCNAVYVPPERTCSVCGAAYDPGARRCPACGTDLLRKCPACSALNPSVVDRCLVCGQEMGILESLFDRVTRKRGDWLNYAREEAPTVKAQQEAASEARLAEMWAAERRRREALAQARAERDRQQRIIVATTVVIVAVVVVVAIVALVITMNRASGPCLYPPY